MLDEVALKHVQAFKSGLGAALAAAHPGVIRRLESAARLDDAEHVAPLHERLRPGEHVLDAGCGLGHGLQALRLAYPQAQLHGIEWSWPLRAVCAVRCPWARVRQGDIWKADWSGYDMVYVFQRPESMARAAAKARAELRPGAWLVSLDFAATDRKSVV